MRLIDGDALMKDLVNAIASQKRWMDSAKKSNSGIVFQLAQQAFFTLVECKQHLEKAPTISPSAQPQVVHCKDCKYSEYDRLCGVMRCTYNGKAEIVNGEHYCGYADMREGQE